MRLFAVLVMALFCHSVLAAERKLTGNEIGVLLQRIIALGKNTRQTFTDTGTTTYIENGQASQGRWHVRGDQYCSSWPPSVLWACYFIHVDNETGGLPATLVWIGDSQKRLVNRVEKKEEQNDR